MDTAGNITQRPIAILLGSNYDDDKIHGIYSVMTFVEQLEFIFLLLVMILTPILNREIGIFCDLIPTIIYTFAVYHAF